MLEKYLKENDLKYHRIDEEAGGFAKFLDRHQIVVFDSEGNRLWDAICHFRSYGYEQGLLEVMGDTVVRESDGDSVCGFLTAQDVIDRIEGRA